jgi:hypothetical protein
MLIYIKIDFKVKFDLQENKTSSIWIFWKINNQPNPI